MSPLKVLTLVHPSCVPPAKATQSDADWADWKTEYYVRETLIKLGHDVLVYGVSDDLGDLKKVIDEFSPHIVFNLLVEFQGEACFEAHLVSFLELMGVPYTGCNPNGLSMGRDKALTKKILNFHGVLTPGFFTVERNKKVQRSTNMKFPMIVKSLVEEASLGISQDSIVHTEEKLKKRVDYIHNRIGTAALVEEYVEGRELYVGVLGNKQIKVLNPWELHFGDLKSLAYPIATRNVKFNKSYCKKHEITHGVAKNLTPRTVKKIKTLCRKSYKALKMSGYARIDLRLTDKGEIYFLEANPNAELANKECFANAARHSGVSYEDLISKILRLGLSYKSVA